MKNIRNFFRKSIAVFVSILIMLPVVAISTHAATYDISIEISDATGLPGDEVIFNVDIPYNPGIMAFTVAFMYDNTVLEYVNYIKGIIKKDTIADHEGYTSIVYCGYSNVTKAGTFFSMKYKIKDGAKAGTYPITIYNIRPKTYGESLKGCFANWDHDTLNATVTRVGTLTVGYNNTNCEHLNCEETVTLEPTCTSVGYKTLTCKNCCHTEQVEIPMTEHTFADSWTIDRPATKALEGIMSRHCLNCDAVCDKTYFPYEDTSEFENTQDSTVTKDDYSKLKIEENTIAEQEEESEIKQEGNTVKTEEIVESKDILATQEDIGSDITEPPAADTLVTNTTQSTLTPLGAFYSFLFGENGFMRYILSLIKNLFEGI